ncbi:unnamed protein product [Ilex paraguariensis]|uniref:Uncharacterized protein n=1 Tax=Ilex paraguariensis TaxID=185542 RepID=A0ABC8SZW5_9AQUA
MHVQELRKQLENQVITIDCLRKENCAAIEHNELEIKDLKASISKSYLDQQEELCQLLDAKQKELAEVNRIYVEQKHAMENLTERIGASMLSCTEANEVINRK